MLTGRRKRGRYRFKRWVNVTAFILLLAFGILFMLKLIPKEFFRQFGGIVISEISEKDRKKLKEIESGDYPEELVNFLENHMEALDFVYKYPENKDKKFSVDLSREASSNEVPLLIQWDERWGYEKYGENFIATGGCGPTALSMAAIYLTKKPEYTPLKVAETAYKKGYYIGGVGSKWSLISEGCSYFGLNSQMVPLDESCMENALKEGQVIIASMGEGDFTRKGHFIVIRGFDDKGFYVNDPASYKNSEIVWEYETLKKQIKNMWAMSAA